MYVCVGGEGGERGVGGGGGADRWLISDLC